MARTGKRQKMWAVMRFLRTFTLREVALAAEAGLSATRRFAGQLRGAGVIEPIGGGAKWRLAVDLGPLHPVFRGRAMFDVNEVKRRGQEGPPMGGPKERPGEGPEASKKKRPRRGGHEAGEGSPSDFRAGHRAADQAGAGPMLGTAGLIVKAIEGSMQRAVRRVLAELQGPDGLRCGGRVAAIKAMAQDAGVIA